MNLVRVYNTNLGAWEVGYWINNTRFIVVDCVRDYDDLVIYQEAA